MAQPKKKYRVHDSPRISANQLAEYLLVSPSRRQTILRNAKFAPTYLVVRYNAAKTAVADYLSNDARPSGILADAGADLLAVSKSPTSSPFQKNDAELSIEAIDSFSAIKTNKELIQLSFQKLTNRLPALPLNGVDVSVNLDLIARRQKTPPLIGGVVFQTAKATTGASWRAEHARNVSSLVWMLAEKHLSALGQVDRKLCLTVDFFGKSITPAPTSYKRRLADFEAACLEIGALWPSIQPPTDLGED